MRFEDRYRAVAGLPLPEERFAFGADPATADRLARLVLDGVKTATTSLLAEYEASEGPLPDVGERAVVLDGSERPVCVIETVHVETRPFVTIDEVYARAEGEPDLASWQRAHRRFFTDLSRELELGFDDQALVVCEHFTCVFPDPAALSLSARDLREAFGVLPHDAHPVEIPSSAD